MTLIRAFVERTNSNRNATYTVTALADGARTLGYDVAVSPILDGYEPCDIAIMWGTGSKRFPHTHARDAIAREHKGGPLVRVELGYMLRDKYFSVGLSEMWGLGKYRFAKARRDRFAALKLEIQPWQSNEAGYALVLGQVPHDTAVQHVDFQAWIQYMESYLNAQGFAVRVRPHPKVEKTRPLDEDLAGAHHAVALTSTCAVDCLLAGVPVAVMDPQSMCWRIAGTGDPSRPHWPKRKRFFDELAYAQWTLEEMQQGLPLQHLLGG